MIVVPVCPPAGRSPTPNHSFGALSAAHGRHAVLGNESADRLHRIEVFHHTAGAAASEAPERSQLALAEVEARPGGRQGTGAFRAGVCVNHVEPTF